MQRQQPSLGGLPNPAGDGGHNMGGPSMDNANALGKFLVHSSSIFTYGYVFISLYLL